MNWQDTEYRKAYGMQEIADDLGVSPNTVRKWKQRQKLPPPDVELACGPIWFGSVVLMYYTEYTEGIECWLAEEFERQLGYPVPAWEMLSTPEGQWRPDAGTTAALDAEDQAVERQYLSPQVLAVVRSAARAHANGESEDRWRKTLLAAAENDADASRFLRKVKSWLREDGLWPW